GRSEGRTLLVGQRPGGALVHSLVPGFMLHRTRPPRVRGTPVASILSRVLWFVPVRLPIADRPQRDHLPDRHQHDTEYADPYRLANLQFLQDASDEKTEAKPGQQAAPERRPHSRPQMPARG